MSTAQPPVRTRDGIDLPIPGIWQLDPSHAEVAFVGRHLMLTKVRGRFGDVRATLEVAEEPSDSRVVATISMTSVDSGDETRDTHLRSSDLFDTARWPHATFVSSTISWEKQSGELTGDLTIRDVTRPVTLAVRFLGALTDPWGNDRAVFEARTTLNREAWGLTWNLTLDAGNMLVSKQIELELHLEFVRSTDAQER